MSFLLNDLWSQVDEDWREALGPSGIAAFERLSVFLAGEAAAGRRTFPAIEDVFAALRLTRLRDVKVVILGQNPFFNAGEAHGLSFSVPRGVALPPSTRNIFEALERDVGFEHPGHGCLEGWAKRGVLLLNTILTVREGKALTHAGEGWEDVTDAILRAVDRKSERVVFMLWGLKAQKKRELITGRDHKVLTSYHPAARRHWRKAFLGCGHFSEANRLLAERGRGEVDWTLSASPTKPDLTGSSVSSGRVSADP